MQQQVESNPEFRAPDPFWRLGARLPNAFSIGPLHIAPNLILAPMSGITDSTFRRTIKEANPDALGLVVSELVSIEGLVRGNRESARMLALDPTEGPVSIQLFGSEPEHMGEAARMAADCGAAVIDINCGCPVPKVVKQGGGAELMRRPAQLARLVRAACRAVSLPITVKIRAGWDEGMRNAVEIAQVAEGEGAAMVAVHGRTRIQLYTGSCDWQLIGEVKAGVRIPVVGSGDVKSPQQALLRMEESGVDGVMIGRGVLTNPWIFRQVADLRAGREADPPNATCAWALLVRLVERLAELDPKRALGRSRGLVCRMTRGLPDSAAWRERASRAPSVEALLGLLHARYA
jgi:nifR3 family TIM-barrel protein